MPLVGAITYFFFFVFRLKSLDWHEWGGQLDQFARLVAITTFTLLISTIEFISI